MKTGLFIRSDKGTFDRFRSRIIFPIFHQSGEVIAFGGRDYKKNDLAKYLNSPETAIYQKSNTLYGLHITKDDIRKKIGENGRIRIVDNFSLKSLNQKYESLYGV